MKFSSKVKEGIAIESVHISRATYNYAQEFKDILDQRINDGKLNIVVCLKGCKYMDSTFLGTLVSAARKLKQSGRSLKISDLHSVTLVLFEITGMMRIFEIYKNIDEAVTSYTHLVD